MEPIIIQGVVDAQHRLSLELPGSLPPGPVTVCIARSSDEDSAGEAWVSGVVQQWADDLGDSRQDIYTLTDGEPLDNAS